VKTAQGLLFTATRYENNLLLRKQLEDASMTSISYYIILPTLRGKVMKKFRQNSILA
jgi:hypothetical protein